MGLRPLLARDDADRCAYATHTGAVMAGSMTASHERFNQRGYPIRDVRISKPLRRWGNAYGIALSRTEVEALGARLGDILEGDLQSHGPGTDLRGITPLRLGGAGDIDETLGDEALAGR